MVAQRQHPWCHRHVVRPATHNAHHQHCCIWRAKSQVGGFNHLQYFVVRQRDRAELTWAWLRHLLSWLWFLGTAIQRVYGCCRPSPCSVGPLPESRCLFNHVAQLALPQSGQQPRCQRCAIRWDPVRPPAQHLLAIRFTSFAAACLIAAHCIFIRAISCSSASTATSERTSAAVCVFCGARTLVCRICKAARMLHESILSEVCIVSAFSVVLCCRVCVPKPRASTSQDSKSRTYMRNSSVHAPVSANIARLPANSILNIHLIPGVSSPPSACPHGPAQAAWDRTRPIGLQHPQPGGIQDASLSLSVCGLSLSLSLCL